MKGLPTFPMKIQAYGDFDRLERMRPIRKQRQEERERKLQEPATKVKVDIEICSRDQWGARQDVGNDWQRPVKFPVHHVRRFDTITDTCVRPEDCYKVLQELQKRDMEKDGCPDIRFNFLIGGDGTIYEGRGWNVDNHDRPWFLHKHNGDCIDIGYIGNVEVEQQLGGWLYDQNNMDGFPTLACHQAAEKLITYGKSMSYIFVNYKSFMY